MATQLDFTQIASPQRHDSFMKNSPTFFRLNGQQVSAERLKIDADNYIRYMAQDEPIAPDKHNEIRWLVSQYDPNHFVLGGVPPLNPSDGVILQVREQCRLAMQGRGQQQRAVNTTAPNTLSTSPPQAVQHQAFTLTPVDPNLFAGAPAPQTWMPRDQSTPQARPAQANETRNHIKTIPVIQQPRTLPQSEVRSPSRPSPLRNPWLGLNSPSKVSNTGIPYKQQPQQYPVQVQGDAVDYSDLFSPQAVVTEEHRSSYEVQPIIQHGYGQQPTAQMTSSVKPTSQNGNATVMATPMFASSAAGVRLIATPRSRNGNIASMPPPRSTASAAGAKPSATPTFQNGAAQGATLPVGLFTPLVSRPASALSMVTPRQQQQSSQVRAKDNDGAQQAAAICNPQYQPGMVPPSTLDILVRDEFKWLESQIAPLAQRCRVKFASCKDDAMKEEFIRYVRQVKLELCRGNMGPARLPPSTMRQQTEKEVIDLTETDATTTTVPEPAPVNTKKRKNAPSPIEEPRPKRKATEKPTAINEEPEASIEELAATTAQILAPVKSKKRKQPSTSTDDPKPKRKAISSTTLRPTAERQKCHTATNTADEEFDLFSSMYVPAAPTQASTIDPKFQLSTKPKTFDLTGPEHIHTSNSGFEVPSPLVRNASPPPTQKQYERARAHGVALTSIDHYASGLEVTVSNIELHHKDLKYAQEALNPAVGAPAAAVLADEAGLTATMSWANLAQTDDMATRPDGVAWTEAGAQLEWEMRLCEQRAYVELE
jgi:hypothetical protein